MYDEDITEILASDGLIGVSLDIRILGMGNDRQVAHEHEAERLSLNEQLFSVHEHLAHGQNDDDHLPDTRIQASLAHVEYLCNNLLHIVRVGRKSIGDRVWDHICVGSDFDGLIVSIEYQPNRRVKANNIPDLRAKLKETLPNVAQKMGMPLIVDGTAPDVFLERVLDKFFLKNALRFLEKYYIPFQSRLRHQSEYSCSGLSQKYILPKHCCQACSALRALRQAQGDRKL